MIYYVAHYTPEEEYGNRSANYAGEDKIDYICETLSKLGEKVILLSNSKSISNKYLSRKKYVKTSNKELVMFASLPYKCKVIHALDVIYGFIQLAIYLYWHVKKDDIVLVYHSLGYRNFFRTFRKIKHFMYILEVEELFQYIDKANSYKKNENKVFLEPDAFIFSNNILEGKINFKRKPSIVINGVYRSETRLCEKIVHKPIKVIYAGSLEAQKGVDYVINSAFFLDSRFEMRIIGFGADDDISRIKKLIKDVQKKTQCQIKYEGSYKGVEYLRYLQQCDIGVCIQNPNDIFNLYEFPSKIFSYMSNGLAVVTNKLEQVEKSLVSNFVTISDGTEPMQIAAAIEKASNKNIDVESLLLMLDKKFSSELSQVLNDVKKRI